jgi:hypothetical protein
MCGVLTGNRRSNYQSGLYPKTEIEL